MLNTNLCTAVAFLVWVGWDYITGRKPSLIGGVNGMIVGLVAITPAAGYVNGWGAIAIGVIASTIVYFALNYLSRLRPFRNVDDTLGVIYTHGFAGLAGGLLTGVFADPNMVFYPGQGKTASISAAGVIHGNWTLLKWQVFAGLFVIVWSALGTFILLKMVGLFIPLRMSEENMEIGDIAEHGHEVYPSDVPSLGYPERGTRDRVGRRTLDADAGITRPAAPGPGGCVRSRARVAPSGVARRVLPAPSPALAEHELGGGAQRRRIAADQQRGDDRLAPRLEVVADLVLGADQRELLDQLASAPPRPPRPYGRRGTAPGSWRPRPRSPSGSRRWRGSSCPAAPIPPKYSAYIGRTASAAASTSSVTISGTVAATSNSSAVRRAPGALQPLAERLAVEVVVVGRVEQRQPAVAQLARQRDVLRALGGEVDRDVARAAGGCSTSAACRGRCRRAAAAGNGGRRW